MLRRIISAAADLVDARYGALGVLDETRTRLKQVITVGLDEEQGEAIEHLPERHGILGLLIVEGKPIRLPGLTEHPDSYGFPPGHPPMRSFRGVPITVRDSVFGNLYLTDKTTAEVFTDVDEELVVGLAGAAGVAIEHPRLAARVHELAVVEDRERIARGLDDTVIQRLFATGMSLQSTVGIVRTDPGTAVGLERQVAARSGVRDRLLTVVGDAVPGIGFEPRVRFEGPVDTVARREVGEAIVAALRDALSNVARHADASGVDVDVLAAEDLFLRDNGIGPPSATVGTGHGVRNLARRAAGFGGTFELRPADGGGSVAEWRVPTS